MLSIRSVASCLHRPVRRFAGDQRATSAIEFGLVLPVMLALWFGAVELSEGIAINRKVTIVARTIADLASQQTLNIDTATMTNLMNATSAVMAPFPASVNGAAGLKVVVSQIKIAGDGTTVTVSWSNANQYGTALTAGNPFTTLPTPFKIANSYVILGTAEYDYTTSFIGRWVLSRNLTLKDQMYMAPRQLKCIQYLNVPATC
jgi:Flp pilus assembly protein TadG